MDLTTLLSLVGVTIMLGTVLWRLAVKVGGHDSAIQNIVETQRDIRDSTKEMVDNITKNHDKSEADIKLRISESNSRIAETQLALARSLENLTTLRENVAEIHGMLKRNGATGHG